MILLSLLLTGCLETFPTGKETTFVDNPTDDFDADGQTEEEGDCDDNNADIYLGSAEFDPDICGPDDDGDGYAPLEVGGTDCNDELSAVHPGAAANEPELCATDIDGDGFAPLEYGGTDCDDSEALALPGGTEVCGDNIDNDCNGETDEPEASDATTWYLDADNDGYGVDNIITIQCVRPNAHTDTPGDCDDSRPLAYPGADEYCDGYDNDCDGRIDDEDDDTVGDAIWYLDADRDGYGIETITLEQCDQPAGYVQLQIFDCDDTNADLSPGEVEVCDGIDNNCDGLIDDADGGVVPDKVWFIDSDNDGHGSNDPSAATLQQCEQPTGYSADDNDCDDSTTDIGPQAAEICDGIDQDCDGLIDDGVQEAWFVDSDQDGFGDPSIAPQYACLDSGPSGFVLDNTDCNDSTNTAYPGADELCDSIDNNCDGITDENTAVDAPTWYLDADGDGFGTPNSTFTSCELLSGFVDNSSDCDDGRDQVRPDAPETCLTAYDDNCDGETNSIDALSCSPFYLDSDEDGYGDANDAHCLCEADVAQLYTALNSADCDDSNAAIKPNVVENCETIGVDDNCDGESNTIGGAFCTTFYYDYDGDSYGLDSDSLCMCEPDSDYTAIDGGDCDDLSALIAPDAIEVCDDLDVDENCDGVADGADAISDGVSPAASTWFRDNDGDGFGSADPTDLDGNGMPDDQRVQCDQPAGFLAVGGDCDDLDPARNPGEIEICSLDPVTQQHRDEDCSGSDNDPVDPITSGCVELFYDGDGDGRGVPGAQCLCYPDNGYTSTLDDDCDDGDAGISPQAQETCATADDEDCDGSIDENGAEGCTYYFYDWDNDGYGVGNDSLCMCEPQGDYRATIGADCNDNDNLVNPGVGNCGLMGTIPISDAALSITGRQADYSNKANQMVGNFDYNNDGISDIAVVDYGYDTQYTDAGALFLYLGPLENTVDVSSGVGADLIFTPNIASAQVGKNGISVGNWDNDPFDEIIVSGTSSTYLINDNLTGQGVVDETHLGVKEMTCGNNICIQPSILGDVNLDGFSDVVIRGILYYGEGNELITDSGINTLGYSESIDSIQHNGIDSNGDGIREWWGRQGQNAYLRTYDTINNTFNSQIITGVTNFYGSTTYGDFNGDGYDDPVISYRYYGHTDTFQGYLSGSGGVWVFYGDPNGISASQATDADWSCFGSEEHEYMGHQMSSADIDNDERDDLIITTEGLGNTFLFYGDLPYCRDENDNPRDCRSDDAHASFSNINYGAVNAGDQNNDGYDDLLIGGLTQDRTIYLFYGADNGP